MQTAARSLAATTSQPLIQPANQVARSLQATRASVNAASMVTATPGVGNGVDIRSGGNSTGITNAGTAARSMQGTPPVHAGAVQIAPGGGSSSQPWISPVAAAVRRFFQVGQTDQEAGLTGILVRRGFALVRFPGFRLPDRAASAGRRACHRLRQDRSCGPGEVCPQHRHSILACPFPAVVARYSLLRVAAGGLAGLAEPVAFIWAEAAVVVCIWAEVVEAAAVVTAESL